MILQFGSQRVIHCERSPRDRVGFHNFFVASRVCIGYHIQLVMMIFDLEIVAKKFAYPSMLGNCSELLIEYELQGKMIGPKNERMSPHIRPPMPEPNCFDKTN
jgi:hypothetical protein